MSSDRSAYNAYRAAVLQFMDNTDRDPYAIWLDYSAWYNSGGKELFISAFFEASESKLPKAKKNEWIFTTAVAQSASDYKKKMSDINYYRANAFWFIEEVEYVISYVPSDEQYQILSQSYARAMEFVRYLLFDSLSLLTNCADIKLGSNSSGIYKNPLTGFDEFYKTARYIIYGPFVQGHHSDISISVIRQALELRFRRAFGIFAKSDLRGNEFPISLSEIIKAIECFQDKITMDLPLHIIKRINGWANTYLHSGIKDFGWTSPRILSYLSDFLLGGKSAPGFIITIDSGISTDKVTFDSIRSLVEDGCGSDYKLVTWPMDKCAIVIA